MQIRPFHFLNLIGGGGGGGGGGEVCPFKFPKTLSA